VWGGTPLLAFLRPKRAVHGRCPRAGRQAGPRRSTRPCKLPDGRPVRAAVGARRARCGPAGRWRAEPVRADRWAG